MLPFDEKACENIASDIEAQSTKVAKAKKAKASTAERSTKGRTADDLHDHYTALLIRAGIEPHAANFGAFRKAWLRMSPDTRDDSYDYAETYVYTETHKKLKATTLLSTQGYLLSECWLSAPAADRAEWTTVAKGSAEATMLLAAGHELAFAPDRHTGTRTALIEAHKLEACRAASEV
jgi:hypothetical protein